MGGVRAQFSTTSSIQMSLYSIPFFRDFEQTMGHPSGYRAQGYLFMATNDRHLAYLHANYEKQIAAGLKTAQLLTADDIVRMVPQTRADDILGGTFCSTDGFVDPYSVMTGFTLRATDQGARFLREATVTGIDRDANNVVAVQSTQGNFATRTIVNAAGAWSAQIAKMAGLDLPVEPLRRMLVPTEPFDKIAHTAPMVIDMASGFHFRPEGLGLLLAWADPDERPSYNTTFDR